MVLSKLSRIATRKSRSHHLAILFAFPFRALVNATWIDRTIKHRRSNPSKIPRSCTCSNTTKKRPLKSKKSLGYQIRSSDRREKTRLPRGDILFVVEKPMGAPVCPENDVFISSPAQCMLVYALRLAILGEWVGNVCVRMSTTRRRPVTGGRGLRPCALCGGVAGLRRRRNGGRSHLRHRQMLQDLLV